MVSKTKGIETDAVHHGCISISFEETVKAGASHSIATMDFKNGILFLFLEFLDEADEAGKPP